MRAHLVRNAERYAQAMPARSQSQSQSQKEREILTYLLGFLPLSLHRPRRCLRFTTKSQSAQDGQGFSLFQSKGKGRQLNASKNAADLRLGKKL